MKILKKVLALICFMLLIPSQAGATVAHIGSIVNGGGASLSGATSVYVVGNYAYVASNTSDALEIINISNPATPTHAGSIVHGAGGALLDGANSVFVSGNYAYVASTNSDALEIINISNPATPTHAGSIVNGAGGALLDGANSVFVSGNYAYVASINSSALEIIDISTPATPAHAGSIANGAGGALLSVASSVYVVGNYAYVASFSSSALEIINISNPASPTHTGSIANGAGGALLGGAYSVFISGNYAYVASRTSDALEIIDISTPATPTHAGSIAHGAGGALLDGAYSVFVSGNYAYVVSTSSSALEVINISNPASPTHVDSIVNGAGGALLALPSSVYVVGDYVYVASRSSNALEIISATFNATPTDISISSQTVNENSSIGTVVGALTTTDADVGDTHTYSLSCTTPGADDASFAISTANLTTNAVFNYETDSSYNICIRTTDTGSATYDENFTITINDLDEILPTITNVNSDKANGSYTTAEVIDIDVTFSEAVTSTGNVTVTLETGGTDRTCTFTVTNSTTGTCNYTVQAGDTTSDLTVSSISGTIADQASNAMSNFIPTTNLASNKALLIDTTTPTFSSITATPTSTTSVITYTTDELSSTIIDYGLTNAYGTSTSESDTSPKVTSHSVELSSLVYCFTYHYRVRSKDAALNETTSAGDTFTTTGCAGEGSVLNESSSSITTASGGTSTLTSGATGIELTIPIGATGTDAIYQIKSLDQTEVFLVSSTPSGVTKAGDYAFDLKALTGVGTSVTTFLEPIEITLTYQDSDIVGLTESSLVLYRWDGATWNALTGCTVNPTLNTVTCTTTNFSVFSLFGTAPVVSAPPGAVSLAFLVQQQANTYSYSCIPGYKFDTKTGQTCATVSTIQSYSCTSGDKYDIKTGLPCATTGANTTTILTKLLKLGITDPEVKVLQEYLNTHGYTLANTGAGSPGYETLKFGFLTKKAVIKFQREHSLTPDGIVGPVTRGALNN